MVHGNDVHLLPFTVLMCVQAFFEGVENLKAGGTKAEEVGYRLDFSRNELKKCIKEYPGKEVPHPTNLTD